MLVCLSACLLVCLSACLLVCLSACLLVCLSACLLVCLSACLSVCLSPFSMVCMFAFFLLGGWALQVCLCLPSLNANTTHAPISSSSVSLFLQYKRSSLAPTPSLSTLTHLTFIAKQCDQNLPSCGQCVRGKRTCPGYRDTTDLMFRDQNNTVVSKVRTREAKSMAKRAAELEQPFVASFSSTESATDSSITSSISSFSDIGSRQSSPAISLPSADDDLVMISLYPPQTSLISMVLTPDAADHALNFFFYNFHDKFQNYNNGGILDHLSELCLKGTYTGNLRRVIISIGLAALGNQNHSSEISLMARKQHLISLHQMNMDLNNPEVRSRNETLCTIPLLGLFELIATPKSNSIECWSNHIKGAAALLENRGIDLLSTYIGRRTFIHVRAQISLNCLNSQLHVPPIISEWTTYMTEILGDRTPPSLLSPVMIRLCALRADVHCRTFPPSESAAILAEALSIEADLAAWERNLPESWIFETHYGHIKSEHIFRGKYHTYVDFFTAVTWNNYRFVRMLTHETILKHLPVTVSLSLNPSPVIEFSSELIYHLALDIAASTPFLLGSIPFDDKKPDSGFCEGNPKVDGGVFLLFPLAVAASTGKKDDPELFDWICDRYEYIWQKLGISQGHYLGKRLRDEGPF
jgi:hypothetical protein